MTAIAFADQSTQIREDTALGPKNFEVHSTTSPEVQQHVELETAILDHWVAFKVAPRFVEKIYAGEPLELDFQTARDSYVLPEYKTEQLHYLQESGYLIGSQVPSLQRRANNNKARQTDLIESIQYVQGRIDQGDSSPKLKQDILSYASQARVKKTEAANIQTDIDRVHLNAKVKDAMFKEIDTFLHHTSNEVRDEKTHEVLYASKKIALEQVILTFKSERALIAADPDEEQEIVRGYDRRIELLEQELAAMKTLDAEVTELIEADSAEVSPSASARITEIRHRLLGSFSTSAAAVYGALFR